jgi:glycosyltransferase involved in cell wall biosynthesis
MKQATICHLTSVHPYDDIRIFFKECHSLAATGYGTHLIAPGAPDDISNGVHLHGMPAESGRLVRMTRTVWRIYRRALAIDADLYHFHDPELIPVGLMLRARGKQVIYDIHEDMPLGILSKEYLPPFVRRPLGRLMKSLEHMVCHQFSALVAATPTIGARFRSINPRTQVINNYPLLDELTSPASTPWTARAHSTVYVGAIALERGIAQMVEAIGHVAPKLQATLDLAGAFSPPDHRDQVAHMPGWERVREHGTLGRAAVAHLLNNARAGLVVLHPLPRFVVSQPIKFYEYMAASVPVIAADFALWREIVEQSGCGLLVDPLAPQTIARAIEFVLTHPCEAEMMGRQGRAAVEQRYNWELEAPKLVALYDHVLRSVQARRRAPASPII